MTFFSRIFLIFLLFCLVSKPTNGQTTACDGTIYLSIQNDLGGASIYTINPHTLDIVFLSELNVGINALGYHPIDHHIYGLRGENLYKLDLQGVQVDVLPITGFTGGSFWAAAFSPEGEYVLTGSDERVVRIAIEGNTASVVAEATKFYTNESGTGKPRFGDLVFDPIDGQCYGVDQTTERLATLDPYTGAVDAFGEDMNISDYIGALFNKIDGEIYGFWFDELYQIDLESGIHSYVKNGPFSFGGIDACSCPFYFDVLQETSKPQTCVGDSIRLSFQLINGTLDTLWNLRFSDTLPNGLFFISDPVMNFSGEVKAQTGFGFDQIIIEQMYLPPGISTLTIDVKIAPTFDQIITQYNQAQVDGFLFPLLPTVFSDYPSTELVDDPTPIVIYPEPQLTTLTRPLTPLCIGDTLMLNAQANTDGTYKWMGPNDFTIKNNQLILPNIDESQSGCYELGFESLEGCFMDTMAFVEVYKSRLNLGNDTTLCLIEPWVLNAGDFQNYHWQDDSDRPYFIVENYGEYSIEVRDENNCLSRDTIQLLAGCPVELYIPNAFSPNGDGINDVFYSYGNDVRSYQLQIYDRWGEMVFESLDFTIGWDGTFRGRAMSTGVYVYQILATFASGQEALFSGDLLLLK